MPVNCCELVLVVKVTADPGGRSARVGVESCSTLVRAPTETEAIVSPAARAHATELDRGGRWGGDPPGVGGIVPPAGSAPVTELAKVLRVLIEPIEAVELMFLIA